VGTRFAVVGSGRQGTAAAYDLALSGGADAVVMADVNLARARRAAARVNRLLGRRVATAAAADATRPSSVLRAIRDADVVLSGAPYFLNLALTKLAIRAGASFVDFGGNDAIVDRQLALDRQARKAGVTVVPDCGMGPGLTVTLAVYAMGFLDEAEEVVVYDGGIPQHPRPPWDYELSFNVDGLTDGYDGDATVLREGRLAQVPVFSEPETIEFPPFGRLEAVFTPGGLGSAPRTFLGKLTTLENKSLRYPGHWDRMRAFRDLGLFSSTPVRVDGVRVVPRNVFHALFEPQVTPAVVRDASVMRVRARGRIGGRRAEVIVDFVDFRDEGTGFTAMERTTGGHAAIVAGLIAAGRIPPGVHPVELGVPAKAFVEEARRRGFRITERVSLLDERE
jgi:lysine 6-dehydrogenase